MNIVVLNATFHFEIEFYFKSAITAMNSYRR